MIRAYRVPESLRAYKTFTGIYADSFINKVYMVEYKRHIQGIYTYTRNILVAIGCQRAYKAYIKHRVIYKSYMAEYHRHIQSISTCTRHTSHIQKPQGA